MKKILTSIIVCVAAIVVIAQKTDIQVSNTALSSSGIIGYASNGYVLDKNKEIIGYYRNGYTFDANNRVTGTYRNGYVFNANDSIIAKYSNGYILNP